MFERDKVCSPSLARSEGTAMKTLKVKFKCTKKERSKRRKHGDLEKYFFLIYVLGQFKILSQNQDKYALTSEFIKNEIDFKSETRVQTFCTAAKRLPRNR